VQSAEKGVLIAGIGVNVNQTAFPEELRPVATSLRIGTGREHSKEELLDGIVTESLKYAALLGDSGKVPILEQFEAQSSYARGKAVEVADGNRVFSGMTAGLDENGFLRVETATGIETVTAGGVRATNA
jgi:BirA family biotin operon repressor/biotin-[acetyl-CoA-carboxylase] ligase